MLFSRCFNISVQFRSLWAQQPKK